MNNFKRYLIIIMLFMTTILLIVSVVFAWMAYVGKKTLASFESGELVVNAKVNNSETQTVTLSSLAYIDFQNDVVLNKSQTLNSLATIITIQIINGETSTPIKNTININEESFKTGLFYLIIYEGKNLPANQIGGPYDYFLRLKQIIGTDTNETIQRQKIDSFNLGTINTIKQVNLAETEWLSFKIAIWGDYSQLVNKLNYLNETFSLKVNITTTQASGV